LSASDRPQLAGRTFVVGGATGAVGSALLARLVGAGARVGVPVRRPHQISAIRAAHGAERVLAASVPANDAEAIAGFVKGVEDSLGPIAGCGSTSGAFLHQTIGGERATDLDELFEANALGPIRLARAVVPAMLKRREGRLVFTGALAVASAPAGLSLYVASKAALHGWASAAAHELQDSGIRVAVLLPGVIDTPANRKAMPSADRSGWLPLETVVEALVQALAGELPGPGPLYPL
jgi:NAD(P)-dependent dehydrogenase (short-subunit alcohol dehydrogenase family)